MSKLRPKCVTSDKPAIAYDERPCHMAAQPSAIISIHRLDQKVDGHSESLFIAFLHGSFSGSAVAKIMDWNGGIVTPGKLKGIPFLHRSLVLITEVDLSTDAERGQESLFENECEGMCGA